MRRTKLSLIGLLCGTLLFLAGVVFSFNTFEVYVAAGIIVVLVYWPFVVFLLRQDPNYKFRDGPREYAAVLLFVAMVVALVFFGTVDALQKLDTQNWALLGGQ